MTIAARARGVGQRRSRSLLSGCSSRPATSRRCEAERTIEAQGRIENLDELVNVAAEYDASERPRRTRWTSSSSRSSLVADADTRSDDDGLVTLMTLHNAKGLEYPIVFMIGCEDGIFPHSRALEEGELEEERRLCYVGITRAQRDLYMTCAEPAHRVRAHGLRDPQPLPRGDPGRADRPRGAAPPRRRGLALRDDHLERIRDGVEPALSGRETGAALGMTADRMRRSHIGLATTFQRPVVR